MFASLNETMRVYRIEDTLGVGPYNSDITDDRIERMRYSHMHPDSHPAWMIDFGRWPNDGERGGFQSMQQMFKWFGGYLPILLAAGYTVKAYDVSIWDVQVGRSGKQLIFQSARACKVDTTK